MTRTIGKSINRNNFLLFLAVGLVFGFRTRNANIFAVDAGFIHSFIIGDLNYYLRDFQTYVPGRILHIFWQ
jgi:VanZ family protein